MHFKAFFFASLASVAVAQTTTACAAQNIVDSCVATIQGILNACDVTDYTCKCTNYTNMLSTCFAACPNEPQVGTYQSLKAQNCAAMSAYGTTTVLSAATSTASATTTHASTSAQSGSASSTNSGSSSSASSTSSSHSGAQAVNAANGLVVLVAAGVAALL